MRSIAIDDPSVAILGALDADVSATGTTPRRVPNWTRAQLPDLLFEAVGTMASGVRLAFRTTSEAVELDVNVSGFRTVDQAPKPALFQLVVEDGTDHVRIVDGPAELALCFVINPADPADVAIERGGPATVRFDRLGEGGKRCELWLPHDASVELRALRIDDNASIGPSERDKRRWVHYGSSISHCLEADEPTGTWPAVAARLAGVELRNLGLGGQCMLDPFMGRTLRDVEADLISVKLGVNIVNGDTMRERTFVPAVHGLLDFIRDGHPDAPLLVVTPIIFPVAEHHPGPTPNTGDGRFGVLDRSPAASEGALSISRIRALLRDVVAARQAAGDTNLHLLEGTELFGPDDVGDLPDGLHPNAAGYRRMGERFHQLVFAPGGVFA